MGITQSPTSFRLDDRLGLYELRTVEATPLIMAKDFTDPISLYKAKKIIMLKNKTRFSTHFGLPLAQDHAELIRNAYAHSEEKGAPEALETLSTCKASYLYWVDNGLFYVVGIDGFDGVIIQDRPLLESNGIQLSKGYGIEDIIKAEKTLVFESSQGKVLVPKDFEGVRIVEGYNFEDRWQSADIFENNPLMVAIFNGQERAAAVAKFATDKRYFRTNNPYVLAEWYADVKRSKDGLVKVALSLQSLKMPDYFNVVACDDPNLPRRMRGVVLK